MTNNKASWRLSSYFFNREHGLFSIPTTTTTIITTGSSAANAAATTITTTKKESVRNSCSNNYYEHSAQQLAVADGEANQKDCNNKKIKK